MNPNHYPSLELCKKLKEIGFSTTERRYWAIQNSAYDCNNKAHTSDSVYVFPCPSVMEMLDIIPYKIKENGEWNYLSVGKTHANYVWNYFSEENVSYEVFQPLPNALAEMILWLNEKGHITFDKK